MKTVKLAVELFQQSSKRGHRVVDDVVPVELPLERPDIASFSSEKKKKSSEAAEAKAVLDAHREATEFAKSEHIVVSHAGRFE